MWCNSSEEATFEGSLPKTLIKTSDENVAVSCNRSVFVHEQESFKQKVQLNFDSEVDVITWSDNSCRFLLIAERSGLLRTIHFRSQRVINTEQLYDGHSEGQQTFLDMKYIESYKLLLVLGSDHVLHTYSNIDYTALDEALCTGSMQKAMSLKQSIVKAQTSVATDTSLMLPYDMFGSLSLSLSLSLFLMGRDNSLYVYDYIDSDWVLAAESRLSGYGDITHAVVITHQYLLTTTDQDVLVMWSLLTYTAVKVWSNFSVKSIASLKETATCLKDVELVISGKLNRDGPSSLSIVTLPEFDTVYSKPCEDVLLDRSYEGHMTVPYICKQDDGDTLCLTSVAQYSHEARLQSLLQRHEFDQALQFAKQHSQDVKLVFRAKADWLSQRSLDKGLANELRVCLDNLTDVHDIVDICMGCHTLYADIYKAILLYGRKRIEKHLGCDCGRVKKILRALQMFQSYTLAFGLDHYSIEGWLSFLHCDLMAEILKLARSQPIQVAMVLWTRHKSEFLEHLTPSWFDDLLSCINATADYPPVCDWLRTQILPVIDLNGSVDYLEVFGRHLERLSRDLELADQPNWPGNSLTVCHVTDDLKSSVLTPSLARLTIMRDNLHTIKELREKYQCYLSYALFCQQTDESMVYRLLDVVSVPSMFCQHFNMISSKYMEQYNMESDYCLHNYVQDLVSNNQYIRGYDPIGLLWEQKAVAVIECIHSICYKIKSVVLLAKQCQTPWSKCIAEIVHATCQYQHDGVDELKDIKMKSCLSYIMSVYNIQREVTPTSSNAFTIVRCILLRSGYKLEGLTHALQVGDALMVPPIRIYMFMCQGRLNKDDEILDVIEVAPADIKSVLITRVVSQACCLLNNKSLTDWDMKARWADAALSLITRFCSFIDDDYFSMSLDDLSNRIKSALSLYKEFNITVGLDEIECPVMEGHLSDLCDSYLSSLTAPTGLEKDTELDCPFLSQLETVMMKLRRFTYYVCISDDVFYQIVWTSILNRYPPITAYLLRFFLRMDSTEKACIFVLDSLRTIIEHEALDVSNAHLLYKITQKCLVNLPSDKLLAGSWIHSLILYFYSLMSNCLGGDYQSHDQSSALDIAELDKIFNRKHYSEKELIVGTSKISQATAKYLHGLLNVTEHGERVDKELYSAYRQTLKSHSHDLLAYRISLYTHLWSSMSQIHNVSEKTTSAENLVQLKNHVSVSMKGTLNDLVTKLMSQRNIDIQLALAAFLDIPASSSLSLIKKTSATFGSQFLRIIALSNIAVVICYRNGQEAYAAKSIALRLEAIWGYLLHLHGVNFLPVFAKKTKSDLLHKVAAKCPLDFINQYIRDFNLECHQNSTYIHRIKHLVSEHSLTSFWSDAEQGRHFLDEIKQLLGVVPERQSWINDIIELCNPYDYTLIRSLLKANAKEHEKKLMLLDLLALYQRLSPPGQWERNMIKEISQDFTDLPTYLSHIDPAVLKRLPYHPLVNGNVWKVLKNELDVKTFRTLQPVASLLEIDMDVFLLNTALQISKGHVKPIPPGQDRATASNNHWCTDEQINSTFFNSIVTVLAAIKEKKSAVMCCQSLISKLPRGVEQSMVIKICLDLAKTWKSSLSESDTDYAVSDSVIKKLTTMYTTMSIEKCLHRYKLSSEKYLDLIEQPVTLIQNIIESTHADTNHAAMEKIEACDQIATLTHRELKSMCFSLITTWLSTTAQQSQSNIDMDMTMTLDLASCMKEAAATGSDNAVASNENRNREKWIVHLANSHIGGSIVHLLNSRFNSMSTTTTSKLLIVRCLLALGSTPLDKMPDKQSPGEYVLLSPDQLVKQQKALTFIQELEKLNISMTVEEYNTADMRALASTLRKNFSTNPTAVCLMADLCIEHSIFDPAVWATILEQLVSLNMMNKLQEVLALCSGHLDLWCMDQFEKAWQKIADSAASDSKSQQLLKSCPILVILRL